MTVRRSRRRTIVALAYHAIADLHDDPVLARWSVAPPAFAAQLDAFAAAGWTFVDLDLVLAVLDGRADPPPRALLLTFDDAYTDLLDTHGDCDQRIGAAVAAAGYELAFAFNPGVITPTSDRFLLPRVPVLGEDTPRSLAIKAATAAWPERRRIHTQRLLCVPR